MTQEVRMLSASGILGYGYPEASLKAGLARKPHMIGVDGGSSESGVLLTEYPPAFAFKATFERRIASGAVGDTDVYGAQQHAPLLDVEIPL